MTILVVDDDPVICNLVALSLEEEGFRVLTANGGREALTRWQSPQDLIDLLITDISMPLIDGPLLARCLGMDDPGFAVLFISGEGDTSELAEFKNSRFLAKPFSRSTLLMEVNRLVKLNAAAAASEWRLSRG
jgi:DNA-binding response OmpR family regulator